MPAPRPVGCPYQQVTLGWEAGLGWAWSFLSIQASNFSSLGDSLHETPFCVLKNMYLFLKCIITSVRSFILSVDFNKILH